MDIARINMAHDVRRIDGGWDFTEHEKAINFVREVSKEVGKEIKILQDISGPKIRFGKIKGGKAYLKKGDRVIISETGEEGERTGENVFKVSINFKGVLKELRKGAHLEVDDGRLTLEVIRVMDDEVECVVLNNHELKEGKGVNIPVSCKELPIIEKKDEEALKFGIEIGVDIVAISFVRNAEDIKKVRGFLNERGGRPLIVAKIERKEGVENLNEILDVSDMLMVARGDLGLDVGLENVPLYQAFIIQKAKLVYKPVIVATQMLASMEHSNRPTRAEVCDIANAVFQGADALMLSDETAGKEAKFPIEAVKWMRRVIEKTEEFKAKNWI